MSGRASRDPRDSVAIKPSDRALNQFGADTIPGLTSALLRVALDGPGLGRGR